MKKLKFAALLLAVLLLLTGCAPKDDFADYEFVEPPAIAGVTAQTEFSEYDGKSEHIIVNVTNDSNEYLDISFDYFSLQKDVDGIWRPISKYNNISSLMGFVCPPHTSRPARVILKDHVKQPLLPGHYRVWVGGENWDVSAEFNIV